MTDRARNLARLTSYAVRLERMVEEARGALEALEARLTATIEEIEQLEAEDDPD